MKTPRLEIGVLLWRRLARQLWKRGEGTHESGAFLLGKPQSRRVARFICYDDLDATALETGIVTFHGHGFVRLWGICEREGLRVLADAHTHGGAWTGQSESDRTHPMVAQAGHIALILPYFARRTNISLKGVGVHEYLGNHEWRRWPGECGFVKVTLI